MNCEEIFVPITDYEDFYMVSNYGNIYSLKNRKMLALAKSSGGYLCVSLYKNKKNCTKNVHRFVAKHFISNEGNFDQVNHIDGNKENNKVNNLEWCSAKHNSRHYLENNLKKNFGCKEVHQYDLNDVFIKSWRSLADVRRKIGICQTSIYYCCSGKLKTAGKFKWTYNKY